jgi:5-methyltetrahydropteroyltriglutamate--homocysteine methyltransferase
MERSESRILTTHCGSLPRPAPIVSLVEAVDQGRAVEDEAFDAAVREAVDDIVRAQVAAGLSVINDGEQSKFNFASYIQRRVSGFTVRVEESNRRVAEMAKYHTYFERKWPFARTRARAVCTGAIKYEGQRAITRDIANVKAAAQDAGVEELFMTAVSPGTVLSVTPNEHYSSEEEYHHALCDALREEYETIVAAGLLLQLDCPDFGRQPRLTDVSLEDHLKMVTRNVELLNYATRTIEPEKMRFHVCWGADEAPHDFDPPLAAMAAMLVRARPQGMTIAAANGRHEHEWRVWQETKLPEGKVLIPGVIDSTTNIIEHPETVAERIERFAGVVGRENVIAGVDCGFDTVAGVEQVDGQIAFAKLSALSAGAELASGRLF